MNPFNSPFELIVFLNLLGVAVAIRWTAPIALSWAIRKFRNRKTKP